VIPRELTRARAKEARRAAAASRDMRWPLAIVSLQLLLLSACVIGYRVTGLTIDWTMPSPVPLVIVALVVWALSYPTTRTDSALAFALLLTGGMLVVATQYPVLAFGRPLVDETLLRMDRAVGIDVVRIVAWMRDQPFLSAAMHYAYATYLPQQFVLIWVLAWLKDRQGIWGFLVQQQLCLCIALVLCALWPASEPYAYLGLDVPYPQTRSVEHIINYNSGAATVVRVESLAGLVSFPSCHVAGAIFFIWAFRRVRFAREAAILVNGLLILATVSHGVHYFMDVVGGVVLAAALIALTEWVAKRTQRERWLRRNVPGKDQAIADGHAVPDGRIEQQLLRAAD